MYRTQFLGGALLEADVGLQRKQLALLALLASARDRPFPRERLCGYLWPESEPERARHRLADCLYGLRQALGGEVVSTEADAVRLDPGAVEVDVWEFEEAAEAGELERAEALYAGPYLDGFYLSGTPAFEKWVDGERERLRRLYLRTLEGLAEGAEGREEWPEAARWWRRRAREDPYDSRVAVRLVVARARTGDAAGAMREAEGHAERLRDELGIEPPAALAELTTRLREESLPTAIDVAELGAPDRGRAPGPPPRTDVVRNADEPEARRRGMRPPAGGPEGSTRARTRLFTRRNAILAAAGAIALLALQLGLYLICRDAGFPASRTLVAAGLFEERAPILLADLEDRGRDSLLAAMLTEAFRLDVSHSEVVRLVGSGTVAAGLRRMRRDPDAPLTAELARELAVREGIQAVLAGAVGRAGDDYVITARLLDPATGEVLTAVRENAAGADEVVGAVDRASRRLREGIGESIEHLARPAAPPPGQDRRFSRPRGPSPCWRKPWSATAPSPWRGGRSGSCSTTGRSTRKADAARAHPCLRAP